MFKRIVVGVLIIVLAAVVAVFALASRPAIDPIAANSAAAFPAELVARGAMLAAAGNCAGCHTSPGGGALAGGVGLRTPFGVVYSSNITPDPDTGIGQWSEAAFGRALHEGVARDGSQLFPVFPFDHFTRVTDDDVAALYAYFMTREPVHSPAKSNTLPFPLNVRALQYVWKLLYFRQGVYQADAGKSPQWNRGAYLALGLSHCSACHTPRNGLGAERSDAVFDGAMIDGWYAPALTAANTAPLPWTQDELFGYLRNGGTALHGVAAGAMSDVVHQGLAKLPDEDVLAIAAYFADFNQSTAVGGAAGANAARGTWADTVAKAVGASSLDAGHATEDGASLYQGACASCHYNSAAAPPAARPELGLNSALTAANPVDFIQVVLHGIGKTDGMPGLMMPGFAGSFSDADVARLAGYLRRTRTAQPAWTDVEMQAAAIRHEIPGT
jgi:mono/diheme cytochrome c family protein